MLVNKMLTIVAALKAHAMRHTSSKGKLFISPTTAKISEAQTFPLLPREFLR
jgi:hypothetical protein